MDPPLDGDRIGPETKTGHRFSGMLANGTASIGKHVCIEFSGGSSQNNGWFKVAIRSPFAERFERASTALQLLRLMVDYWRPDHAFAAPDRFGKACMHATKALYDSPVGRIPGTVWTPPTVALRWLYYSRNFGDPQSIPGDLLWQIRFGAEGIYLQTSDILPAESDSALVKQVAHWTKALADAGVLTDSHLSEGAVDVRPNRDARYLAPEKVEITSPLK